MNQPDNENIVYRLMDLSITGRLGEIDRSETIDLTYEMDQGTLLETETHMECLSWSTDDLKEIQEQYRLELTKGGMAIGAFAGETLVGFGVLGHQFVGPDHDQLPVQLMYVSRNFRRQGIGTRILEMIGDEAGKRGAKYLYISATETQSAVSFYFSNGSNVLDVADKELLKKEPKDIHMSKKLF
ncbi:MAG: family N-acetyltransferase [Mucilaginibacter sp.]|nr:family N-acetyltransferase [Mucilaginibacter sp.]